MYIYLFIYSSAINKHCFYYGLQGKKCGHILRFIFAISVLTEITGTLIVLEYGLRLWTADDA